MHQASSRKMNEAKLLDEVPPDMFFTSNIAAAFQPSRYIARLGEELEVLTGVLLWALRTDA